MIRQATPKDASRLAEILIFAKRTAYRPIFHADEVSFNEMQVLGLALDYRDRPDTLDGVYVLDDGIVRGMMRIAEHPNEYWELKELYIDPFFQQMGYGKQLLQALIKMTREHSAIGITLWVLEKNDAARAFYQAHGFAWDGEKKPEQGTPEWLMHYTLHL